MPLQTAVLHKAGVGALSVALDEPAVSRLLRKILSPPVAFLLSR